MANQPYYQLRTLSVQAGDSLVRSVWVPADPVMQSYIDYNSSLALGGSFGSSQAINSYATSDGFYILITGAIGSIAVARMRVTLVYQFHPLDTISAYIGQQNAGPGAQTRLLQSNLSKAKPYITFCSTSESRQIVEIMDTVESVDVNVVQAAILGVPVSASVVAAASGYSVGSSNITSLSTMPKIALPSVSVSPPSDVESSIPSGAFPKDNDFLAKYLASKKGS